jgi:hypothetical protein
MADRWLGLAEELRHRLGPRAEVDAQRRAGPEGRVGPLSSDAFVHANPMGHTLAREMGADAFALGRAIVGPSALTETGNRRGEALLAHELTHVGELAPAPSHVTTVAPTAAPGTGLNIQREKDEQQAEAAESKVLNRPAEKKAPRKPTREEVEAVVERVYDLWVRDAANSRERLGSPGRTYGPWSR